MKRFRVAAALYLLVVAVWVLQFVTNLPSGAVPRAAALSTHPAFQDTTPTYAPQGIVANYDDLLKALRANGAEPVPTDKPVSTLFDVNGHVVMVIGGELQVFEYADVSAVAKQITEISSDGGTIHSSMMSWSATPHFYRQGKLIVLYVGSNPIVFRVLTKLVGTQFAGG